MQSLRLRVYLVGGVVLLLFGVLLLRLSRLQISQHDQWKELSREKREFSGLATPGRGEIRDCEGVVLARDQASFDLSVVVSRAELKEVVVADVEAHLELTGEERAAARADAVARLAACEQLVVDLARVTSRPAEEVADNLYEAIERVARRWERSSSPQPVVRNLDKALWMRLKLHQESAGEIAALQGLPEHRRRRTLRELERARPLPGIRCTASRRRVYPQGQTACHIVGYLREYTREDYEALRAGSRVVRFSKWRQNRWQEFWDALSAGERKHLVRLLGLRPVEETDERIHHVAEVIGALRTLPADVRGDVAELIKDRDGLLEAWFAGRDTVELNPGERLWVDAGRYLEDMTLGAAGLECLYNQTLRGKAGYKLLLRTLGGNEAHAAGPAGDDGLQFLHATKPQSGTALTLTLDLRLQRVAEDALRRHGRSGKGLQRGAAILMDLRNDDLHQPGDILVLASVPTFDPNLFVPPRRPQVAALLKDENRPLVNRAISDQYPLGSVIKPFMSLVALREGVTTTTRRIDCRRVFRLSPRSRTRWTCMHACGPLKVDEAICHSCNVTYYTLATELGIERLMPWMKQIGFGEPSGLDLPGEIGGIRPSPEWKKRVFGARARRYRRRAQEKDAEAAQATDPAEAQRLRAKAAYYRQRAEAWQWESTWLPGDTVNLGIGQGILAVTPMQALRTVQVVAGDGRLYQPRLVRPEQPVAPQRVLDFAPEHLALVKKGMVDVTETRAGTAYRVMRRALHGSGRSFARQFPDIRVAAKTGSAETGRRTSGRDYTHSWFAGYAPADDPEVAFVVLLEEAGYGGQAAAPAALEILRAYFETTRGSR